MNNNIRLDDVQVRPEAPFDRLMANAVVGELFARQVRIASIDDLLTMKTGTGRGKDAIDIEELRKIQARKMS